MDSLLNSTRSLRRTNTNTPQIFHEIKRERTLPQSFYEVISILIPKPDKDAITTTKKKREL
jgi:hypothetical protein